MKKMPISCCVAAAGAALLALVPGASAEDVVRVAAPQRGAWELAAPELGQQAGIFKKYGIVLDLAYGQGNGELEQAVLSGNVDVGLGASAMAAMRAYARGGPVRIIGANRTGAALYWYVPSTSAIRTVQDFVGKTIGYATNGSTSHYDAIDLMKQFKVKARLIPTGEPAATFGQLMANQVDVGWATPPFGVEELDQGKIRVVAHANDISLVRDKTVSVMITNADTLQRRKAVVARFMQAYRDTVQWMYSDPAALARYAALAGVSEGVARRLRDEFFTRDMLVPDKIGGLKTILKDAVVFRYLQTKLSRKQVGELIQIPPPVGGNQTECHGWLRCSPLGLAVIPD